MDRAPFRDDAKDSERRSSSRSIKRRRFDDELVEYGAASPKTPSAPAPRTPPEMLNPQSAERKKHTSKQPGGPSRRSKKKGHLSALSTKDLGRWKPTDDLALIIAVKQTNDMRIVHRGTKFTCRFTLAEVQSRWSTLLYKPEISRLAVAAMQNLHPDLVAHIRAKAPFSNAEEDLLRSLPSNSQPTADDFADLLERNPTVFYPSRTAKSLGAHWRLLKQYGLLTDQPVQTLPRGDNALSFSDAEDTMADMELQEPRDDALDTELAVADRWAKKEIRLLENSIGRWQVLVESAVGGGGPDFDKQTLAVLRGRQVRYLMRSREITIGRVTNDHNVDVDLNLEGPAGKISRRQGTIRLRNSGDFFLSSEGKRPFYVDGMPILNGCKVKLNHNSVMEISSLRFVFLINQDLVNAIRQEAVKINIAMP